MESVTRSAKDRAGSLAARTQLHWGKLRGELERLETLRQQLDAGVKAEKFTPQYARDHLRQVREQAHQRMATESQALLSEIAALMPDRDAYTPAGQMRAARFRDAAEEANTVQRLTRSCREDLATMAKEAAAAGNYAALREAMREARYRAEREGDDGRRTLADVDAIVRALDANPPKDAAHAALVFDGLGQEGRFVEQSLKALQTGEADESLRGRALVKLHAEIADMERLGVPRRFGIMLGADNCGRLAPEDQAALDSARQASAA